MEQFKKGIELRNEGHVEESAELLEQLVQLDPNNGYLYYECAASFDALGDERKAIPYYEKAIKLGLEPEVLVKAYTNAGSSYRANGHYDRAKTIFEEGRNRFPENQALNMFYAMVLYNLNEHSHAMEVLLNVVIKTSSDNHVRDYEKAISFYRDKLDKTW
ncbi:tetratricopeptide repeat protein [Alteribacter aurantiacus]|uniref:tetratricopeptide repeat protein n=1 Tax=Alteribacter aurantiacus TaxID=254410 RepID=UPI000410117F